MLLNSLTYDRHVGSMCKISQHWIRTEYINIHLNEINRKFHFTICYLHQISLLFNYEFHTHPHMHACIHSRMCAPPCEYNIFTVLEFSVTLMKETLGKKHSELCFPLCCHLFFFAFEIILTMTMMRSVSHSIYSFIFSFVISLILEFSIFASPISKYKLLLFKMTLLICCTLKHYNTKATESPGSIGVSFRDHFISCMFINYSNDSS